MPNAWLALLEGKFCGYAGGLGPLTLADQLPVIDLTASGKCYWIDMETSLRTVDDRFCIDSAAAALEIANDFHF